jgi:hypothetical protein
VLDAYEIVPFDSAHAAVRPKIDRHPVHFHEYLSHSRCEKIVNLRIGYDWVICTANQMYEVKGAIVSADLPQPVECRLHNSQTAPLSVLPCHRDYLKIGVREHRRERCVRNPFVDMEEKVAPWAIQTP